MSARRRKLRTRDIAVIVLLALLLFALFAGRTHEPLLERTQALTVAGTEIAVEIRSTPEERAQGLSGRPTLPEGHGMLFVFEEAGKYGFWMPDMHFAIDIVWIGADRRIVDIARDVSPESYPATFTPKADALYVLEVPAGTASRFGWQAGDVALMPLPNE